MFIVFIFISYINWWLNNILILCEFFVVRDGGILEEIWIIGDMVKIFLYYFEIIWFIILWILYINECLCL